MYRHHIQNFLKSTTAIVSIEYAIGLALIGLSLGLGFKAAGDEVQKTMVHMATRSNQ